MCGKMIEVFGEESYICGNCIRELDNFKKTLQPPMTKRQIDEAIDGFMKSSTGTYSDKHETEADIDEVFKQKLRNTDDSPY